MWRRFLGVLYLSVLQEPNVTARVREQLMIAFVA